MFKAYPLPPVTFAFGRHPGPDKLRGLGPDKLRGLQEFRPYQEIATNKPPRFGFVFPSKYRDQANRLYLALKNGIGYFRGVESTFQFPFQREQVFPVTGFSIPENVKPQEAARIYADAILSWNKRTNEHPDMFFVLHPRTSKWEEETPYYECKTILLQEGILSQNVTVELIDDSAKFEWSVANIALGAFVKLGGIPWVLHEEGPDQGLVIGIGRANLYDPQKRQTTHFIGFTSCFSARGLFKFISLADVARDRAEYLKMLRNVVISSLEKAEQLGNNVTSLTLHVPKEMGQDEDDVITKAVNGHATKYLPQISVVKVTDETVYFAVDERSPEGVPARGTVIQVSDREYILYTEGREEKQVWRQRVPTALRVVPQDPHLAPQRISELIRQIHDLSQVNWRAFNARSKPISIHYGKLIAGILSRVPRNTVKNLYSDKCREILEERMWFI